MRDFTITMSDIKKCPDLRLDPEHYRDDGTCLHHEPVESAAFREKIVTAAINRHGLAVIRFRGGEHDGALSIEMSNWQQHLGRMVVYLAEDERRQLIESLGGTP